MSEKIRERQTGGEEKAALGAKRKQIDPNLVAVTHFNTGASWTDFCIYISDLMQPHIRDLKANRCNVAWLDATITCCY